MQILLSTVEMVLQKQYSFSKLKETMNRVTRVIIDEASLLTEAALFALIRRFPKVWRILTTKSLWKQFYYNKIIDIYILCDILIFKILEYVVILLIIEYA